MNSKKKEKSEGRIISTVLFVFVLALLINLTTAATPNPGHPWTEVGDGLIQFSTPTALRTYNLPDTSADILTDYNLQQGDLLYADAASSTARLPKVSGVTKYLTNTGVNNNPAWGDIDLAGAGILGVLPATRGGTGNASTTFTGMTSARTYTLPDLNTPLMALKSGLGVNLAQGGTSATTSSYYEGVPVYKTVSGEITSSLGKMVDTGYFEGTPFFFNSSVSDPIYLDKSGVNGIGYPTTTSAFGKMLVSNIVGINPKTGFSAQIEMLTMVSRTMYIFKNIGATTATNVGFPAAPTLTTTLTSADDALAPWLNHATTATAGNSSGVISAAFTYIRPDWSPKFSAYIKTDATTITTTGYWVGMFSASPDNTTAPNIHAAAFRYYTSVDGTAFWRTVTIAGTGASATVTTTTQSILANTAYQLNIDCTSGSDCKFYINGSLVSTHTTQLPASGQTMGYGARVTALAAAARNIKWSRISVAHN